MRLAEGPHARQLESLFEDRWQRYAVAVNNGTTALFAALVALDCTNPSMRVGIPAFGFHAAAHACLQAGATPVFVDVDPIRGCVDPHTLPTGLDALVVIDLDGWVPDYSRYRAILGPDVPIIQDSCPSIGSPRAGTEGDLAVFSGNETKKWSCGEGGMLLAKDPGWAELARGCTRFGELNYKTGTERVSNVRGCNGKIPELSAMVGLTDLAYLDERTERADANYRRLVDRLNLPDPGSELTGWHKIRCRVEPPHQFPTSPLDVAPLHRHPLFKPFAVGSRFPGADTMFLSTVLGDRTHTPWSPEFTTITALVAGKEQTPS